jgi:hypothetical protein
VTYAFNPGFALSAGVSALPATHTNMGNWPLWLGAERSIGDDYLKLGYTQGVWAEGRLAPKFLYKVVLGNNINTIGVDPGQLDNNLNTIGAALWWMPTTGEWGPRNGAIGDFEMHETPATLFGVSYTHSREDKFALASRWRRSSRSRGRTPSGTTWASMPRARCSTRSSRSSRTRAPR